MKLAGLLAASAVRGWMSTLDYKGALYDPAVDPVDSRCRGQKIYIFWHENILFPLYLRGHCNLAMLLSRHRDADILLEAARHLGFEFVRGSTFGGGSAALRELWRKAEQMNLAITPDGPRGPRRVLAQGPIYLVVEARHADGGDGLWLRSTLAAADLGPLCHSQAVLAAPAAWSARRWSFRPNLDRDGVEHYRLQVERLLNRLTCRSRGLGRSRHAEGRRNDAAARAGLVEAASRPGTMSPPIRRIDCLSPGAAQATR